MLINIDYHRPQIGDKMLKNTEKIAIIKHFITSMLLIGLVLLAFGISMDDSYAVELNESCDEAEMGADVEDTLENSQNEDEMMEVNDQNEDEVMSIDSLNDDELGEEPIILNGGTFRDIQRAVNGAAAGSKIILNGNFSSSSAADEIKVTKRIQFVSTDSATLNANNKCRIFFVDSTAVGCRFENLKFTGGYADYGGAIFIKSNRVIVAKCEFDNNYATKGGGAIKAPNNSDGGHNTIVRDSVFANNYAKEVAGALALQGNNSKIINCTFISNKASNDNGIAYGGAISISSDVLNYVGFVRNCTFIGNSAFSKNGHSHGGAGCIRSGVEYKNSVFINNSADEGGALTYHSSGSLTNCNFSGNLALDYGGALSTGLKFDETMDLKIYNSVFSENEAPLGGAAQLSGQNILLENCTFNNNHASENGGAANIVAGNVILENAVFNGNIAEVDGGAVFMNGKDVLVSNSYFKNNSAIPDYDKYDEGLGGAVYVNSTGAVFMNNDFLFNTARNGSAIYYDKFGQNLKLENNTLFQNQAWVYHLPISAEDIYYDENEKITVVIHGGNNIAKYDNLALSNAIYNAADYSKIEIDGEHPVNGATNSGILYQDDREYNIEILLTVEKDDGTLIYNDTLNSDYLGEISREFYGLNPGKYYVTAKHLEDTYYKGITNRTTFTVTSKLDNKVLKTAKSDSVNYEDMVVWTLNITNYGPNNATGVTVNDVLPEGLIWFDDDTDGAYDPETGILYIGDLEVGQTVVYNIITIVNKTGELVNKVNITSNEYDYNVTNNYDEESINVLPACDLEVIKTVDNPNPNYRDLIVWNIVVRNNGPDIATGVVLNDVLPESLIWINNTGNYNHTSGVWEIGTMIPGDEVSLNITCRVNATGNLTNDVFVKSEEFDYDMSNNYDSEMVHVNLSSDLSIIKSVNASEANLNDLIKWTLIISNNGPDNATGIVVVDALPKGFVYVDSNLERGTYSDGVISIDDLAVGESLTLEIICRVDATGDFVNIANITGNQYDFNMANNQDNESISINPACDLEVVKTVNDTMPDYRGYVKWDINVRNNGPDAASDVVLRDVLPKSLIWINDTSDGKYNPNTGNWTIGHLNPNDSVRISIITQVNATGLIVNNVSVSAHEFDYDLTNNVDNESIKIENTVDVEIIKVVNQTHPNYGDIIKWTLKAKNNGPDKATGVYILDNLPDGLEMLNATATKGFYDNGVWAVCCLENGDEETLEIICRVTKTGNITNVASINATEVDCNLTNNDDKESISVPLAVDLEVIKSVTNKNPLFGQTITWIICIKNNGPDDATNVVLYDVLDGGLIFKGYNATVGQYINDKWVIGNLSVNQVEYLNITCEVNKLDIIFNEAYANSSEYDVNKSNNWDSEYISSIPVADLSVIKLVNNSSPNYGDSVKWTIIVTNNGPNDATNVVVKDTLPNDLTLIRTSEPADANGNWNIEKLPVNQTKRFEIICKITSTGTFKNVVNVRGDEIDPNSSNNFAESSIVVKPASDLSITKTVSKYRYVVGDVMRYSVRVTNNGPDTARNIRVSEIFDEEALTLKSVEVTKGTYNKSDQTWSIPSLDNGKMARLYIKALAKCAGKVKNAVSVSSDTFDFNKSNNVDKVIVDVAKKDKVVKKPAKKENESEILKETTMTKETIKITKALSKKESTGNPLAILLSSVLLSIVFLATDISKKR